MSGLNYDSMFPEAFPLPQEQGGTIPLANSAGLETTSGQCEYDTAIRAGFQPKVAGAALPIDRRGMQRADFRRILQWLVGRAPVSPEGVFGLV